MTLSNRQQRQSFELECSALFNVPYVGFWKPELLRLERGRLERPGEQIGELGLHGGPIGPALIDDVAQCANHSRRRTRGASRLRPVYVELRLLERSKSHQPLQLRRLPAAVYFPVEISAIRFWKRLPESMRAIALDIARGLVGLR